MARINEHYRKLSAGYLFPEIGRRVHAAAKTFSRVPLELAGTTPAPSSPVRMKFANVKASLDSLGPGDLLGGERLGVMLDLERRAVLAQVGLESLATGHDGPSSSGCPPG